MKKLLQVIHHRPLNCHRNPPTPLSPSKPTAKKPKAPPSEPVMCPDSKGEGASQSCSSAPPVPQPDQRRSAARTEDPPQGLESQQLVRNPSGPRSTSCNPLLFCCVVGDVHEAVLVNTKTTETLQSTTATGWPYQVWPRRPVVTFHPLDAFPLPMPTPDRWVAAMGCHCEGHEHCAAPPPLLVEDVDRLIDV